MGRQFLAKNIIVFQLNDLIYFITLGLLGCKPNTLIE